MKTNLSVIIIATAALLITASCTKQESFEMQEKEQSSGDGRTFNAVIEQGFTKTTLTEANKVYWEMGDRVNINGAEYSAIPKSPASRAVFQHREGPVPATGPYTAIYPASLYNAATGGFELPDTISYVPGKLNTPMYAESDTEELSFKNICGVLCLSLAGTELMKSITVTAEENICGPFIVDIAQDGGFSTILTGEDCDANKTVTLDFGENPIELYGSYIEGASHDTIATKFYIPIPAGTYHGLTITVAIDNAPKPELKKISTGEIIIEPNILYTLDWDITVPISEQLYYAFKDIVDNQPKFAAASDEAIMAGKDEENYFLPKIHTWEYNYAAIEKIDRLVSLAEPTVQGWTEGELRFMRAFLYFELFKTYGEIPVSPEYSTLLSFGEIVEFIENELAGEDNNDPDAVVNKLPASYTENKTIDLGNGIEITRPTKWAAKAVLARTGLYYYSPLFDNGEVSCFTKADVAELYKNVIDNSGAVLLSDYRHLWGVKDDWDENTYDDLDNREMIFGVRYTDPYFANVYPSQSLVDQYPDDDPRKGCIIGMPPSSPNGYALKKGVVAGRTTHVLPIFRFGGILLDYAELTYDVEPLNRVRVRVGLAPHAAYSADYCKNERLCELAFEGHRFWDVRRWKEGPTCFGGIKKVGFDTQGNQTEPIIIDEKWGLNDDYYFYPRPDGSKTAGLKSL